jgi:hypothetical protein
MAKAKKTTQEQEQSAGRTDFRDAAYNEIYTNFRTDYEVKYEQFLEKHGSDARMTADSERMLVIPYLDKVGLDDLDKITNEALLIQNKTSKQPKAVRDCVVILCNSIVMKYRQIMANEAAKQNNGTTEKPKANKKSRKAQSAK